MKEINGDLIELALKGEFDIIAHGCNCWNTMGSGIAKTIREKIPEAYKADNLTMDGNYNKLGGYTVASHIRKDDTTLIVYNLYTQYNYGKPSPGCDIPLDYEALILALRKMKISILNNNNEILKIGLPKIGAGLAGGDWNKIKSIIEKELEGLDITIVNFIPKENSVPV